MQTFFYGKSVKFRDIIKSSDVTKTNHCQRSFRNQLQHRLWTDRGWHLIAEDRLEEWCRCIWLDCWDAAQRHHTGCLEMCTIDEELRAIHWRRLRPDLGQWQEFHQVVL